jgi:sulfur-oxidizing protein SoxY
MSPASDAQPGQALPPRRRWLLALARGALGLFAWQAWPARAQRMVSGQLLSLPQMLEPLLQGRVAQPKGLRLELPVLVDNGSLVPVRVQVDSPMTEQDHVTHIYLLSQRNPVTRMAVFHLGPWNGRAEINTRIRLAGTQVVVALARLSNGEFRYDAVDIIVTEYGAAEIAGLSIAERSHALAQISHPDFREQLLSTAEVWPSD